MTDLSPQAAESEPATGVPPGRPVRLVATPPGLWRVVLGLFVGALAPLFGFLIGGALGTDPNSPNNPMYIALFIGILVGGVGVLVALSGGVALWRHVRDQELTADEPPA